MELARVIVTSNRDTTEVVENFSKYCDVEVIWEDLVEKKGKRWPIRNSNLLKSRIWHTETYCIIDDDMRVLDDRFMEGFKLAQAFGFCVPMSPRNFVHVSIDSKPDIPDDMKNSLRYATEYNVSPMFINPIHPATRLFFPVWKKQLEKPCRGTTSLWRTAWMTGIHPYTLSPNWCVCHEDIERLDPIMYHVGHKEVREKYESRIATYSST